MDIYTELHYSPNISKVFQLSWGIFRLDILKYQANVYTSINTYFSLLPRSLILKNFTFRSHINKLP